MPAPSEHRADEFGPYELYERLGLGGMATVHRAKKRGIEGFERIVALKRMLSHLAEDGSFVDSFIREAKLASLLQHPNVAQVYDFGRISGVYYIAMELVSGFDLRKLLRYANKANESIPLPVVLSILGELCDALDYAHGFVDEQGTHLQIIHRDISPSNLIIAHTGHLKVIDFGIAKASSRQLHTESGLVKGKVGYMSPEAALGIPLTPTADIFSVGVVAWELVTASPLFSSRTDFETMRRIREADVMPPSQRNPSCPPELDRVILNALERDADRRLPSAAAFRNAIDTIAARAGVQTNARTVAEWCQQYTQPSDSWAHSATSTPGRRLPLPPQLPTASDKPITRTSSRLQRSTEDIKLAAEIWGDEIMTAAAAPPGGDFSHQVATPSPTPAPPQPLAATVALAPSSLPLPVITSQPSQVRSQRRRTPLITLLVLAGLAGVLATYLLATRTSKSSAPVPTTAVIAFAVTPADAIVEIDGKVAPATGELAAGMYSVSIRREGYRGWASSVTVHTGQPQTVQVVLEREVVAIEMPPATPIPPSVRPTPPPTPTTKPAKKGGTKPEIRRVETPPAPDPTPAVTVTKPAPTPPVTPRVTPPVTVPVTPPVTPGKPARTPVVASTAVSKLSGEVPQLRAKGSESNGDVLVKMCIDERGSVTSVKIVQSTADVAGELQRALATWRYKPYVNADQKVSPVCFPLSLRLVFKRAD